MPIQLLFRQRTRNIPLDKFWVGFVVRFWNRVESKSIPCCKAIEIASIGLSTKEDKREINGFSLPNDLRYKNLTDLQVVPGLYISIEDPKLVFTEYEFLESVDFVFAARGGATLAELAGTTTVTVFNQDHPHGLVLEIYEDHSNAKAVLLPIIGMVNGERQFTIGGALRELDDYPGEIEEFCGKHAACLIDTPKAKLKPRTIMSLLTAKRRKKIKKVDASFGADQSIPSFSAKETPTFPVPNSVAPAPNPRDTLAKPIPSDNFIAAFGVVAFVALVISLLVAIFSGWQPVSTCSGAWSFLNFLNPNCKPIPKKPPCLGAVSISGLANTECIPLSICPSLEEVINKTEGKYILLEINKLIDNSSCSSLIEPDKLKEMKELAELLDQRKLKRKLKEPRNTILQFRKIRKAYPNVLYFQEISKTFENDAKKDCIDSGNEWSEDSKNKSNKPRFECYVNHGKTNPLHEVPAELLEPPGGTP